MARNPPTPYTAVQLRRDVRQVRLQELGYRSYPHYLRSPRWAGKRREYQASGLPQDCFCGETKGIQLHHMTYERVGREELSDLTPLCSTCHAMIHALEARGEIGLDFTGFVNEQRAAQRATEVEAKRLERELDWDHDVAFFEDLRHKVEAIMRMPGAKKDFGHSIWRVLSEFKKLETHLDRVKTKFVPKHP